MTKLQTNRHIWDVELKNSVAMRKVLLSYALLAEYSAYL
jgi:hypothetical protein